MDGLFCMTLPRRDERDDRDRMMGAFYMRRESVHKHVAIDADCHGKTCFDADSIRDEGYVGVIQFTMLCVL
jgi:hypothetical protein